MWTHGIISDEAWANILANCTFSPKDDHHCFNAAHSFTWGTYDRYDIYAPVCLQADNGTFFASSHVRVTTGHLLGVQIIRGKNTVI